MDERTRRSWRRAASAVVSTVLVALLLSACGIGGDDDAATETSEVAEIATTAPDDTTPSPQVLIPSPGAGSTTIGGAPASPETGGATPTPAIVVSAPPLLIPTVAATPAGSEPAVAASAGGAAMGDGTGGPAAVAPEQPMASPAAGGETMVVSSCDVASYLPYLGDQPSQVTISDVNFRAGPGTDCDVIGEPIGAGVVVEVLSEPVQREGEDAIWIAVSIDGTQGWLTTEFLEPAAE
jgi:hypothetical protein